MTHVIGLTLVFASTLWIFYTFVGYPLLLRIWARDRAPISVEIPGVPPLISISVPAFNEAAQIEATLASLLRIDYPPERRQILVISDASTDGTDGLVRGFADQGVELFRLAHRVGKTAAENAAAPHLRGEIVINTDASIRISPKSVMELVRQFSDPTVGLASGTDISVSAKSLDAIEDADTIGRNAGESAYVGAEMGIRALETRAGGIVGASGCFYAVRKDLHTKPLPDDLSRDFGAALITREHGFRSVSVPTATARVPRADSLAREYRRKVRTMTRGIRTLWHKKQMLNPTRHGRFAVMLFSHKVMRWGLPWAALAGTVGLSMLLPHPAAAAALVFVASGVAWACLTWVLAARGHLSGRAAVPAWVFSALVAAAHATIRAAITGGDAVWEPTRRESVPSH